MKLLVRFVVALALLGLGGTLLPAGAQTIVTIASGFNEPGGLAIDGSGNLFVADAGDNAAKEILAAGGYGTVRSFGGQFGAKLGVALDGQNNLFVADALNNSVKELTAASGYATVKALGSGFNNPQAVAVDAGGNVFVANTNGDSVAEILAAGGYVTVKQTLGGQQFDAPIGVAVDTHGNVFVTTSTELYEIPAAGGYSTTHAIAVAGDIAQILAVAVDQSGNLFVLAQVETSYGALLEIEAAGGYSTIKTLVPQIPAPTGIGAAGITVDHAGNVYLADYGGGIVTELFVAGGYSSSETLGSGFSHPHSIAVDSAGNLFVADSGNAALDEVLAAGGYTTVKTLGWGLFMPDDVAVDGAGNLFVADTLDNAIKEIVAVNGSLPASPVVRSLGSGFNQPPGVTVDFHGNVFLTDEGDAVKEIPAAGGYSTVTTLYSSDMGGIGGIAVDGNGDLFVANGTWGVLGFLAVNGSILPGTQPIGIGNGTFHGAQGVAVDRANNVYVTDTHSGTVSLVLAAGGYSAVQTLATGVGYPKGVAVDGSGNVFFVDAMAQAVKEIPAPPFVAAVLPGARSVQTGHPATFFATVINTGATALNGCLVAVPPAFTASPSSAFSFLTLTYQTTNPSTNALTGTPNTPASIPANGSQTFFFSLQGPAALSTPAMPINFTCTGTSQAAYVAGVDTVGLAMSNNPVADIIALAATPTNNGIVEVPNGGAAAFSVASTNVGPSGMITVSVDTGSASLPVALNLCETDPATSQCLAAPTGSVTLSYAGGAAPTFSVFVQATGPIPFAPGLSRAFIRFKDAGGGLHGSTSVALETQ